MGSGLGIAQVACLFAQQEALKPLSLKDPWRRYEIFACEQCGLELDRDTNAARNILAKAFGRTGRGLFARSRPAPSVGCCSETQPD